MRTLTPFTKHYQPRFQAYLKHIEATEGTEISLPDFISWIGTHAEAFKKIKGENFIRPSEQDEFTNYVWEQVNK